MRIIPTKVHGVLDYLYGLVALAAPWLFGFARGGAETWVFIAVGVVAFVYSIATNYELGVIPLLSMGKHLVLDAVMGVFLVVSPWLFGFADYVWLPHVIFGVIPLATSLLTNPRPAQFVPRTEQQENHDESPHRQDT